MKYLGDIKPSAILDFKFVTAAAATGAPTTLSGTPVVSVYKDNGTGESTTGATLTADFDAKTGLNHVRIDTSADTTFYSEGSNFQVVITTGTVGGTSAIGYVVGEFSIGNRHKLGVFNVGPYLRKYATAVTTGAGKGIRIAIPKHGGGYTLNADWTPAAGDIKVSIDGAAEANIATLPAFVNGGWEFTFSSAEVTGKSVTVRITDAVPRVIAEGLLTIETFGHASAMYPDDMSAASADAATIASTVRDVSNAAPAAGSWGEKVNLIYAQVDTEVAAIKTQTDKLTFGVANVLDVNVLRINSVVIIGGGTLGNEFHP